MWKLLQEQAPASWTLKILVQSLVYGVLQIYQYSDKKWRECKMEINPS